MSNTIRYLFSFSILMLMSMVLSNCADEKPAKQNFVREAKQTDPPYIQLTDEIIYPGSEPFEDAVYHYFSPDSQAKVAHWFEVNLENSEVTRNKGAETGNEVWYIKYGDLMIVVLKGPDDGTSLIQYKKEIE